MRERAEIVGVRAWKRWQVDAFLRNEYRELRYARGRADALARQSRLGGDLVVWASREPSGLAADAAAQGVRVVRIEDGFLRSVGLGSNHVGGASLVIDSEGIYFDPARPSALERLLDRNDFDAPLLERARRLRELLVERRLSKYNIGRRTVALGGQGRRRLLVPGQVEDDASIRLGAREVGGNLELLRRVRDAEPRAWIVYKPHPDIEAGNRAGALKPREVLKVADEIVSGVSPADLFPQVDGVHTMTSLLGFEALLRGVPVTTWGQPFYAGWGLTEDRHPVSRRRRRRSLDELVAASLILYPRYIDPDSRKACSPESVVEWLSAQPPADARDEGSNSRRALRWGRGLVRSTIGANGR